MSTKSFILFISLPLFFLLSCSPELDFNKIQRNAVKINANKFIEYIVFENGDTLQGEGLKFRYYKATFSQPPATYNQQKISFTHVIYYQNKDAYCLYDNVTKYPLYRLCYGKINMYYSLPRGSGPIMNTNTQLHSPYEFNISGSVPGQVYFTIDDKTFYFNSDIDLLKELIKDNSIALSYYEKSLKGKGKYRYIPYKKLYELINIFNQNN